MVEALSDSPTPRQYWEKVKKREFTAFQLSPIWVQLKLESADGKKHKTDCANTKAIKSRGHRSNGKNNCLTYLLPTAPDLLEIDR